MKEQVLDWCKTLTGILSLTEFNRVELISRWANAGEFGNEFKATKSVPYGEDKQIVSMWVCEIRVNDRCIFKESITPQEPITENEVENIVLKKLMSSVFNHGVVYAKQNIDKRGNVK